MSGNSKYQEIIDIIKKASSFGFAEIKNAKLFGKVPHIAPEAWFHILYPPLEKNYLINLEKEINILLPEDFKNFLLFSNGLKIYSGEINIYGKRFNFDRNIEAALSQPFSIKTPNVDERPKNAKKNYLFVGGYIDDGSKLFIDGSDGKVYRCDRWDSSKLLNVWDNFDDMLIKEVKRLEKLFDDQGHLLDEIVPTTPKSNF